MRLHNGISARNASRRGPVRRWAPLALAPVVLSALAACGSSSGSGDATGADFYKGKTITYITGAPGTGLAQQIDAMKPAIEKYLHATLQVKYNTATSAVSFDQVASAKADGMTIGEISPLVAVSAIASSADKGGITFDPTKVSYVGAAQNPASLVVACKGSSYKTFDDVANSSSTAKVLTVPNGPAAELAHMLFTSYPAPHSYTTGYTSATIVPGCQRGDGNVAVAGINSFIDASGTKVVSNVTPLLVIGTVPEGAGSSELKALPTLADYSKEHPPTTTEGTQALDLANTQFQSNAPELATFGPAGIPADRLKALQDAMAYAMKQTSVQQALAKANIPPGLISGADTLAFVKQATTDQPKIQALMSN